MKKLAVILGLLLLCGNSVLADEVTNANQEIVSDSNKAVISIQKQPIDEKSTQKQDVKKNWFCVIIQVNGKIADIDKK